MNLNPSRPTLAVKTDNLKSLFRIQGVTTFTNETTLVVVVVVVVVNPGDQEGSSTVWPHRQSDGLIFCQDEPWLWGWPGLTDLQY